MDAGLLNSDTSIAEDVLGIQKSLDDLKDNLCLQQDVVARDFETRLRHAYDDVITDINQIRDRVNCLGSGYASESELLSCNPKRSNKTNANEFKYKKNKVKKSNLRYSRSVDFSETIDLTDGLKRFIPIERRFGQSLRSLCASSVSIWSSVKCRAHVPGYGCCFHGDGKTLPYRSYTPWYAERRVRSVSTASFDSVLDHDCPWSSCDDVTDDNAFCDVSHDWRVKVAPHMWEGWPVPGVGPCELEKARMLLKRFKEMKHEILVAHNECRKLHGSREVVKSKSLSRDAQRWAEAVAARGYAQYSDTSDRGENILVLDLESEINLTGNDVVHTWYRESKNYSYYQNCWQRGTSNFTQLIWKSTTEIGVGISKFPYHDTLVVVVQYSPPGNHNIPKEFQENVCPPKPIRGPKELKENICPPIHTSAPNEFQKNASPSTQSEKQKASEKIECVPKHKHTPKECQENTNPSKHTGVSKQYQNNLKRNQQIQEPKQYHASGIETIANESDRQDLAKENTNEEKERIENIAERENSIDHVGFEPAVFDKAQPEDNASLITRTTGFSTVKNDNVFVNSDSARDKATPMTGEHNDGVISCMKNAIKNAPIDGESPTKPRRKRVILSI
ncbi:uncharacterized protein LOC128236099 [Mya arenaria]|uniref:uncharacterized protein LOC128236099 n=1 Tax=Mya arenaria TaxID=6604 RepID=UPI0022DF6BD6|nr:uncharacterized protein LOC128236099 [Mya arenaria]